MHAYGIKKKKKEAYSHGSITSHIGENNNNKKKMLLMSKRLGCCICVAFFTAIQTHFFLAK